MDRKEESEQICWSELSGQYNNSSIVSGDVIGMIITALRSIYYIIPITPVLETSSAEDPAVSEQWQMHWDAPQRRASNFSRGPTKPLALERPTCHR